MVTDADLPPPLLYGAHPNASGTGIDTGFISSTAPHRLSDKKDGAGIEISTQLVEKSASEELSLAAEVDEDHALLGTDDPFPEDPHALPEPHQLTVRAIAIGCILGGVIAASNVYLGLKTGWTFGSSLFGSIFGFAIIKPLSRILPPYLGGGYFGPKENVCVMSAATAAGSLGLLFASGFPAMYQLGIMGASPKDDIGRLFTFTICCAYFGIFFTIPLRKFYILKLKLMFPNAVATAYTIRSLHVGKNAAENARKKTYGLLVSFVCAISWRVVSEYAPGIMWDWHWSWWLYRAGWTWIIRAENFAWVIEWTPAFLGVGFLVGVSNSASFLGGSVLAWMIIGPALITTGKAFGVAYNPQYPGYINMMGMVLTDPVNEPSPRYWLIWPGTFILICASFAEVFCNFSGGFQAIHQACQPFVARFRKSPPSTTNDLELSSDEQIYDPVPPHEQVPTWMWVGGMLAATVMTMIVMSTQFSQNAGVTLLAIIIAFFFSLIGAECSGRNSVTPVTSIGNASQLIFGGVSKGRNLGVADNQRLNLLTGMITLGAAEQCADMLGDLKTTHLLGASPRIQLYAQCFGALVSIFMSAGVYVLFSTAYPCINNLEQSATCSFPAPDVASWRAVAVAVSSPALPIPPSSGYTAIGLGILAILTTIAKYRFVAPHKRYLVPNWNAIGIAFILNNTCTYPIAMFIGSVAGVVWKKYGGASYYAMYLFPVAAGMIAGEGLGGIVNAVLQIAGVSGSVHGTAVGCPMNVYCG